MSEMAMTNRDRIDRGMACLADGLAPLVDARMTAAFPGGADWATAMASREPSRADASRRFSVSDPRFLLRVLTEEWRLFRDQLSRVERGYAAELRDAGNRWAHGEPFSDEDTHRTLDTMERLLNAAGAAEQASQVRRLRREASQHDTKPSAFPARAAKPPPPALSEPGRGPSGGFWSVVGFGDVLSAIEEYDQIGQEQFLAR